MPAPARPWSVDLPIQDPEYWSPVYRRGEAWHVVVTSSSASGPARDRVLTPDGPGASSAFELIPKWRVAEDSGGIWSVTAGTLATEGLWFGVLEEGSSEPRRVFEIPTTFPDPLAFGDTRPLRAIAGDVFKLEGFGYGVDMYVVGQTTRRHRTERKYWMTFADDIAARVNEYGMAYAIEFSEDRGRATSKHQLLLHRFDADGDEMFRAELDLPGSVGWVRDVAPGAAGSTFVIAGPRGRYPERPDEGAMFHVAASGKVAGPFPLPMMEVPEQGRDQVLTICDGRVWAFARGGGAGAMDLYAVELGPTGAIGEPSRVWSVEVGARAELTPLKTVCADGELVVWFQSEDPDAMPTRHFHAFGWGVK